MAYIYKLIFDNGDFYIGQTSNIEVRITNHRSSKGKGSPKLQKAFKTSKYLGYEILEECDEILKKQHILKSLTRLSIRYLVGIH